MKLNPNFLRRSVDGGMLIVPIADEEFNGLIRGNRSVEAILELLDHDTTEEEIVAAMCARFDGDPAVIREDVADVLSRLSEVGAIVE